MMRMRHIGYRLAKLMAMAWIMGFASLLGSREAWPGATSFTPISQLHHMHGLAVSPRDPRLLYIATHPRQQETLLASTRSGLLQSGDGGNPGRLRAKPLPGSR